jgi:polysaccharide pyruvyl transferase WcaK-like protein
VVILKRPFVMLPQTYGPFRSRLSRTVASFFLRRAETIFTRDKNCLALVEKLSGKKADFCPDVAFTLPCVRPERIDFEPSGCDLKRLPLLVAVNVSGLLYRGGYTEDNMFGLQGDYKCLIDELLRTVLSRTEAKVLLIPHVFGSEREEEACREILVSLRPLYPARVFALTTTLSEREVKWLIGQTHFLIGSRMHACIAALSQCIPAIGLAYSDKFLGVFDSAGVGDQIIDLRTHDTKQVIERTLVAIHERATTQKMLQNRIPGVQAQVYETFSRLVASRFPVDGQAQGLGQSRYGPPMGNP